MAPAPVATAPVVTAPVAIALVAIAPVALGPMASVSPIFPASVAKRKVKLYQGALICPVQVFTKTEF